MIRYHLHWLWLRLNPKRGKRCGDLDCLCDTCTTPDCPCASEKG